ncbi:MAG TPA: ribosome silencing factor [Ruminiclostridium sp.]|uniref:Ribosomal silencing factor RsfS n=1 Tax=Acetivibrio saccincola TaxID=1677857 RepID=A0A2K9EDA6_9FIRM|nr:ribosome silencing factor [Acetivibrio saccincola]HAA43346.1 ribosome silencing factor [Ruminiclostridium sp.]AUG57195.1 Ribosomal silencing factor RsfS [Acetivibrio saccincola]NLW26166.1 ribosome silencing factor [Acetivibrio saccincola]PQQ67178.1 ribosome silencing factor [Acetivibrio saccincola]HOA97844.1 ribosome silencing factor [Acetivibrio saccincola]
MKPDKIAKKIADVLEDKKAKDIKIINIRELSTLADYFVIASGTSVINIKMLSDEVEAKMEEENVKLLHREGYNSARWVLMDYGSVVVHIFHEEDREFYNLERLWSDGMKEQS